MLALLFTYPVFPAQRRAKAVYCLRSSSGEWNLQRLRPLINPRAGTVFAQMSFTGSVLETVRLRQFHPNREVAFEYRFDGLGRLTGLLGDVEMWGQWLAEADLYPETDGTVGPGEVKDYTSFSGDEKQRAKVSQQYEAGQIMGPL